MQHTETQRDSEFYALDSYIISLVNQAKTGVAHSY
jgi:hypothetical protein